MGESLAGSLSRKPQRTSEGALGTTPSMRPTGQQRLLNLQRAAGNQAVTGLLHLTHVPDVPESDWLSGRPLEPATRLLMESRLGHDFSSVRVHTGQTAVESARRVNAQAFTAGDDVVLAAQDRSPRAGKALLAHELAHVVQQHRGGGAPGPAHEAEAAAAARAVMAGRAPVVTLGAAKGSVQCADPAPPAVTPPSWLSGVP